MQVLYHLETKGWHNRNKFMSEFITIQLFLKVGGKKKILHIWVVFRISALDAFPG